MITIINSVFLAVNSLHSSCSHLRTVTVESPPRVTERISFSIIKSATSSVYTITPAAWLGLAKERHMTGFLGGDVQISMYDVMVSTPP